MQPLPTEAAPRSVCAHCGGSLPPPNGSPTFVYGVGAVGYQNCPACGAKWRYLWQDVPPVRVKPEGRGRRVVLLVAGVALVVGVLVAGAALARSQPWNSDPEAKHPTAPSTTPPTSASTAPSTAPPATAVVPTSGDEFEALSNKANAARHDFMKWANTNAQSTPQFQVNNLTKSYMKTANAQISELESTTWADVAAAHVAKLVAAYKAFMHDVESIQFGLLDSPSFVEKLNKEALDVRDADNVVRADFGLRQSS